jgi:hypothetical protein
LLEHPIISDGRQARACAPNARGERFRDRDPLFPAPLAKLRPPEDRIVRHIRPAELTNGSNPPSCAFRQHEPRSVCSPSTSATPPARHRHRARLGSRYLSGCDGSPLRRGAAGPRPSAPLVGIRAERRLAKVDWWKGVDSLRTHDGGRWPTLAPGGSRARDRGLVDAPLLPARSRLRTGSPGHVGEPGALDARARLGGLCHCATAYFPSIIMLPSMSLSEWLGPKLSSRLLVSIRRPLLAPSVIVPTRWV